MGAAQFHAQAAVLLAVLAERPGAVEWRVRLADSSVARALAYASLSGRLAVGQSVWVNTTAVELGLGTGGVHFVLAPRDTPATPDITEIGTAPDPAAGHLMKLRYTPLQHVAGPQVEEEIAYRAAVGPEYQLARLPVLAAELHSGAMAAALAAQACGARRIVYVMSDGAALPMAFCRLSARLRADGVIASVITAGQAFGGDWEAVTVASALAAAKALLEADLVIVGQGPGNAGTGTFLGFSGLAQAEHLNSAAALGGRPVALLRVSFDDPRRRHREVSHHALAVLGRMALARVDVAVPALGGPFDEALRRAIAKANLPGRHLLRRVEADDLLDALMPYRELLTTMGRTIDDDRAFFLAACAAARLAMDPTAGQPWPDEG